MGESDNGYAILFYMERVDFSMAFSDMGALVVF